jgi:hypothetical protein
MNAYRFTRWSSFNFYENPNKAATQSSYQELYAWRQLDTSSRFGPGLHPHDDRLERTKMKMRKTSWTEYTRKLLHSLRRSPSPIRKPWLPVSAFSARGRWNLMARKNLMVPAEAG